MSWDDDMNMFDRMFADRIARNDSPAVLMLDTGMLEQLPACRQHDLAANTELDWAALDRGLENA